MRTRSEPAVALLKRGSADVVAAATVANRMPSATVLFTAPITNDWKAPKFAGVNANLDGDSVTQAELFVTRVTLTAANWERGARVWWRERRRVGRWGEGVGGDTRGMP